MDGPKPGIGCCHLDASPYFPGWAAKPSAYVNTLPSLRSNALLLTKLMLPPIDAPSMSGVGAFVTSIVSMLPNDACSNSNWRPVLADDEVETCWPSIVTEFKEGPTPRILT